MREPSVHITESRLIDLINRFNHSNKLSIPAENLALYLLEKGRIFNLSNRLILDNTKKNRRKGFYLSSSPEEDAHLFANTLKMAREKLKHRGNKRYKENSAEWNQIKEAASLANEFCESFELPKNRGYIIFVNELLKLPTKFNIRQVSRKFDWVVSRYEAKMAIESDDDPTFTEQICMNYQRMIEDKTGNKFEYQLFPEKYIHFIDAAKIAKKLGLTPNQYIEGHFESISWTSGIPAIQSLSSEASVDRIIKWMGENDIRKNNVPKDITGQELRNIIKYGHR